MNFQAAQAAVTKLQELQKENVDSKPQSLHSRSTETLAQKRLPGLKMDMTNRKLSQQAEPEGSTVDTMKSQSWINTSAADTSVQCKANRIYHWSPMPSLKSQLDGTRDVWETRLCNRGFDFTICIGDAMFEYFLVYRLDTVKYAELNTLFQGIISRANGQ